MLSQAAIAQAPVAQTPADPAAPQPDAATPQRRFQPPPMPDFMLKPSAQPLSHEEKMRQAEEAAARVRKPQAEVPAAPAEETDNKSHK
jgi:hypothetical protein